MSGPASKERLTIICGNAGVGKTTFARKLALKERAVLLELDTSSEALVRAGLSALGMDPNDRDSLRYKSIYREAIHTALFTLAKDNLGSIPCILVAPFTQERRNPAFVEELSERLECEIRVLYLTCDETLRRKRIEQRNNPRDRSKLDDWEAYSSLSVDASAPPFPHTLIDTGLPDATSDYLKRDS